MKLVEAESTGPVEGEDAVVTAPRPPHRRVSVSLVFTLSVLIGTVVTIYVVFPARHNVLVTEAIEHHHDEPAAWDLPSPTDAELRAWAIGVVGKTPPLPAPGVTVIGARKIEVLEHGAALIRIRAGSDEITYVVQHARGIAPDHAEQSDGDVKAIAWRSGKFSCVAVGPASSAKTWLAAIKPR